MPRTPTLPQNDPEPETREAELRAIADLYALDPEKLAPLILCRGVPEPERAALGWYVEAGRVATPIAANMVANRVAQIEADRAAEAGEGAPARPTRPARPARPARPKRPSRPALLDNLPSRRPPATGERLSREAKAAIARLEGFEGLLDRLDPELAGKRPAPPVRLPDAIDPLAVVQQKVDGALRFVLSGGTGKALGIFEEDTPIYGYRSPRPARRGASLADFDAQYRHLRGAPPTRAEVLDDAAFARRRVTGPNPLLLQRVERLPDNLPVGDDALRRATAAGDSLTAAGAEGRLFLLDHAPLDALLEPGEARPGEEMHVYAAMSVFALPPGGGALRPVAIQCGQTPGERTPILTPADGWAWAMARYVVEVAEMNYFEAVTHLGLTHLLVEPAALATRMFLAPNHPLSLLLVPHFEGTISVNDMAVHNLAADHGAIDQTFGASIESIRGAAAAAVLGHDFRKETVPAMLARRGLMDRDVLPDHPFRDDALRVRGAIARWVERYLRHVYPDEASLAADGELGAWAARLGSRPAEGGLAGFGAVRSRAELIEVVTELVYIASAGHAAVNFPQWSDAAYAPRMTGACWAPAPTAREGYTEADWIAMMPPLDRAELHLEFLYLLGTFYYTRLGRYDAPGKHDQPYFADAAVASALLPAFQADLRRIEATIEEDNRSRRSTPYRHLLPSRIPQSINV